MSISPTLQGTGTAPITERRASPRRSVVDRRLVTVNLDKKDAGLMVDISESGMAVQALARLKPGADAFLQFELPGAAARIEASGTIAWADEISGRAGIRYHGLSEASAACLKEWLGREAAQDRPATLVGTSAAAASALAGPGSKVAEIAALQREIAGRGLDRDAALSLIVQRARGLTRADGAAIVLGDSRWMTCRATSGAAPRVGADLRPEMGLSGECVRTGVTVRCEDTELDPRVDREACRSLNVRSAVIVPLFARGNVSGLLEVFYAAPRAFDGRDVLTLRRMADLISATTAAPVSREPRTPPQRAASPAPLIPPLPPALSQRAKACNVCGHENLQAGSACEKCEGPLPGRPSPQTTKRAGTVGVSESQSEEPKPWITLRLNASPRLLILMAVLLLLAGIWGWQEYKSRQASDAAPTNATSAIELPASR